MPTTWTRRIPIQNPFFNTMRLFDYHSPEKVCSYITNAINHECRLLSKISKKFDQDEGPMNRPAVIQKDARQEINRLLGKSNRVGGIIIIITDDNESQKMATRQGPGGKVSSQTLKRMKQTKKTSKDSNRSKDATEESNANQGFELRP